MLTPNRIAARTEWAQHWRAPLACAAGIAVSVTPLNTIGVLIPAIRQEFGWPVSQITSGVLVLSVVALLFSGLVGAQVDKYGSRRVGLIGLCLYPCLFAALATTGPSIVNWWLLWLVLGFGNLLVSSAVWVPAIAARFQASRGLAIAVMLCGTGLSAGTLPFITTLLLERYGWRGACAGVALIDAAFAVPIVWLLLRNTPAPLTCARPGAPENTPSNVGLTLREAVRSSEYIMIAISAFVLTFGITALVVLFVPIMKSTGVTPRVAAATAGLTGIAMIIGRLGTGALLDRLGRPWIAGISFSLPALACLLLIAAPQPFSPAMVAVLIGLSLGSELDIVAYASTRYFGLRHVGLIFGTLVGMVSVAAGLGPLFAGLMFDAFGNYRTLVVALLPLFLFAAFLMASLGAYPPQGSVIDKPYHRR